MYPKELFTNKSFCVLPWSGFILESDGDVKNCVISTNTLGNIQNQKITDLVNGEKNKKLQQEMIKDNKPSGCAGCYLQERGRNDISAISSRLYYLRELGQSFIKKPDEFVLRHIDLRWTNSCNQACVYCGPKWSSKWAKELDVKIKSDRSKKEEVKKYIFENIKTLENVYLAGGEPMLMRDNKELLEQLWEKNPDVVLRVNTNLSHTNTGIFDLICKFKNVHWTISVETTGEHYEYVRYHGKWNEFLQNLKFIQKLDHKISFNMLYFILNYDTFFDTIDYFKDLGFGDNSFIAGPLYEPRALNVLNLPDEELESIMSKLENKIKHSKHYLRNSYENIYKYIKNTKWNKDMDLFYSFMNTLDKRRGLNAGETFKCLKIFQK